MIKEFGVESNKRNELIDITKEVRDIVSKSGILEGNCVVYCPHTTAGITINEGADPDVQKDILWKLKEVFPEQVEYKHNEGNSDAHIKSSLVGVSCLIIVDNSSLKLGRWQSVYFCEFDGPKRREVIVKVIEG